MSPEHTEEESDRKAESRLSTFLPRQPPTPSSNLCAVRCNQACHNRAVLPCAAEIVSSYPIRHVDLGDGGEDTGVPSPEYGFLRALHRDVQNASRRKVSRPRWFAFENRKVIGVIVIARPASRQQRDGSLGP